MTKSYFTSNDKILKLFEDYGVGDHEEYMRGMIAIGYDKGYTEGFLDAMAGTKGGTQKKEPRPTSLGSESRYAKSCIRV